MSVTTCGDILAEVTRRNKLNEQLMLDYNNKKAAVDAQIATLRSQRAAINVPSRNINDYQKVWTDKYYGCDGDRYNGHKSQCLTKNVNGFGAGAYEWSGEMQHTWGACLGGLSGCCETIGQCSVKQSYINGIADNEQAKINNLDKQISILVDESAGLDPHLYGGDTFACCQSIDISKINADTVTVNEITQTCNVSKPTPDPEPAPTSPVTATQTAATTDNSMTIFFFVIIFIIFLILGGLGIYLYLGSESFTEHIDI